MDTPRNLNNSPETIPIPIIQGVNLALLVCMDRTSTAPVFRITTLCQERSVNAGTCQRSMEYIEKKYRRISAKSPHRRKRQCTDVVIARSSKEKTNLLMVVVFSRDRVPHPMQQQSSGNRRPVFYNDLDCSASGAHFWSDNGQVMQGEQRLGSSFESHTTTRPISLSSQELSICEQPPSTPLSSPPLSSDISPSNLHREHLPLLL